MKRSTFQEPPGYEEGEGQVKRLRQSLYRLKQAGRKWYDALTHVLTDLGLRVSQADPGVFRAQVGEHTLILAVHVDDCTITGSSPELIAEYKRKTQCQVCPHRPGANSLATRHQDCPRSFGADDLTISIMLHRLHSRAFQFGRRGGTGHPDGAERDLLEGGQPCGRVPRRANEDAIQGGYRQPHVRLGRYSPRYHFRHFAIISIPCQSRGGSLGRGKVRLPLSGRHDLMTQFKEILGWDEAMERSALAKEREELYQPPGRPLTILGRPSREELNIRYGSNRHLPADVRACRLVSLSGHEIGFVVQEINVECSSRDEMCKSVLNDE